jgi:hypothetical protein
MAVGAGEEGDECDGADAGTKLSPIHIQVLVLVIVLVLVLVLEF